jgi:serine/threonine-protein kinase HipA
MAMAALGNNKHYKWDGILPRHWSSTAKHVGLPHADAEATLHDVVARGAGAIAAVQAQLPAGFPDAVATPILDGVARALQQLGAG